MNTITLFGAAMFLVLMGIGVGTAFERHNNAIATDQLINCLAGLEVCGMTAKERAAKTQEIIKRMEHLK